MKIFEKNLFFILTLLVIRVKCQKQSLVLGSRRGSHIMEKHKVTTEDGYILTIHRIPGGPHSIPVYLQHGLFESSKFWTIADETKSLAHILANSGYDVWLGNARGNRFSRSHTNLSTDDPQFWDFTWHEIGYYDLPAALTYIFNLRQKKLHYIGHSMGGTDFCVMASERPEIQQYVRSFIGLAPAVYEFNLRGPLSTFATIRPILNLGLESTTYQMVGRNILLDFLASYACPLYVIRIPFCAEVIFLIGGYSFKQTNMTLLPAIMREFPADTSSKLLDHWFQQINVDEFRQYDYGLEGNMKRYNNPRPPSYNLTRLTVPVAVFWSENDYIVNYEDAMKFYNQVSNKMGFFKVEDPEFNHFDFLWGINAPELLYKKVLELLELNNG